MVLTIALLAMVGLSLGLIGGGGSVLAVPVLVYAAHMVPKDAIAGSLLLVSLTSAWAGVRYWKKGDVRPYLVGLFSLSGIAGSALGSQWTHQVSNEFLMSSFAGIMILIGVYMIRNVSRCSTLVTGICKPNIYISLLAGFVVGALTGFLGVGGGFMIVPVLAFLLKCSMQAAIGTSLAIISINSLVSFFFHHTQMTISTTDLALMAMAMLTGTALSSYFSNKIDSARLAKLFALLIIVTGLCVGLQTWM